MAFRSRRQAPRLPDMNQALDAAIAKLAAKTGHKLTESQRVIPETMTFAEWCEKLGDEGLKVDGKPFTLKNRPAMRFIYDLIPSTKEQAFRKVLVLMKCAQVGFTVMEMLAMIYLGLKFSPCTVGMFLPDMALAAVKSTERFMPIIRTVPEAHALMTQEAVDGSGRKKGEGNVRTRRMGDCLYVFSWTSGRATTESIPMDFLSFDEVQEMTTSQMEKTQERLSDSVYRYTLMGSTANWPDSDIHFWFKLGKQYHFHTQCPVCGVKKPLDDYFPASIKWDKDAIDELTGRPGLHRYVCESGHWIDDPQIGEWIAKFPEEWIDSIHFPQFLSPRMSAGEIMSKYQKSTDKKNFFNRVLGKPYLDPTQIPVTLEHMANCVAAGKAAGIKWKQSASGTFMGIDQMGNYNVCVLKERLPDGRQAVIHLEEIYSPDPFQRCSELMDQYGVTVAVCEINPNYNDAKRFANRHPGRVFICNGFGALPDDMVKWGDAPKMDASDRRTDEEERDRWTVRTDQFKCMQTSMARFTPAAPLCLFPDPQELVQEIIDKGIKQPAAVAPRAFLHFTKTALVSEKDDETNAYKRVVRKVGNFDPHFSYANELCDVAWARSHGTNTFILSQGPMAHEEKRIVAVEQGMPGLPTGVVDMLATIPAGVVCGRCTSFDAGTCTDRDLRVAPADPGCPFFIAKAS